jgi:hypothetical protein
MFLSDKIPQNNFFSIHKWKFWIGLAIFLKLMGLLHFAGNHRYNDIPGFYGAVGGDTKEFFDPVENLIKTGHYSGDLRMPGYGAIYFLLRIFLPLLVAYNAMVLLQIVVGAIALYLLALTSSRIFKRVTAFYYVFFMMLLIQETNSYDYVLMSESFTASFLIFFAWFLSAWFENSQRKKFLLISGFFLALATFLRPVYGLLLPITGAALTIKLLRENRRELTRGLVVFFVPFILTDSLWVVRNYLEYHGIFPLTRTIIQPLRDNSGYKQSLIYFMKSWGGSIIEWVPGEEIRCFYAQGDCPRPAYWEQQYDNLISIPSYIYTSKFNRDSLINIKKDIDIFFTIETANAQDPRLERLNKNLSLRFNAFSRSIKSEKPFLYYVRSRINILYKYFTRKTGMYPLFDHPYSKFKLAVLGLEDLLYYFVLITGLLGSFILLMKNIFIWKTGNYSGLMVSIIFIYGTFITAVAFKATEHRYIIPTFSFCIVCSFWFLAWMVKRTKLIIAGYNGRST